MTIIIQPALTEDLPAILQLLGDSRLPRDGFADHLASALVARDDGRVVGSAGLELYGTAALLRSVAVEAALRGQGLGQRLTRAALDLARQQGIRDVYLLTETAGEFFPRFGFRAIERENVPATVQTSVEFTTACATNALVMWAALG